MKKVFLSMRKLIALTGVAVITTGAFAGQTGQNIDFTASLQGGYTNFSSSENEFDYRYEVKLKGILKTQNGFVVKVGDTYQYWKYNDWVKQLGRDDSHSINVPFIKVGKYFNDKVYGEVGGFYVSGDTDKLLADGSFDINLTLEGKVNNYLTLGLFNSYYRIANGNSDADIVQITPYAEFNYKRLFGRIYASGQNIRATFGDTTVGKAYARGGLDIGYRIIPQKLGVMIGGAIGKGWYWINPNGEDIHPMFRPQMGNAYIGGYWKPLKEKPLVIKAGVSYEVWKTIDINKEDIDNQSGLGINIGLSYSF